MAKEKNEYIELIPFVEDNGVKIKRVLTANTRLPYDFDKSEYQIMRRHGSKFIMVKCDFVLLEIE